MIQLANVIDGVKVAPQSGDYFNSFNPATNAVHCAIPDSDERDVAAAVAAAQRAFPAWAATPVAARAAMLERIADGIRDHAEALVAAESADQGKPRWLARKVDIPRSELNFRFFAGAIQQQQELATHMDGRALNYVHRRPVGVAGLISPWNLPLYLLTWKIAPALAAGNAVVAKPSELTSHTAFLLSDIIQQAGVPDGLFNLVLGSGTKAGAALVADPRVPVISFTGGTATAHAISVAAAPHFKRLSLELGGKNANIVFADADLDRAVPESIRAGFTNQGEVCLCGSRILVERSIYGRFCEQFAAGVKALKVGDPADDGTNLGPLVSRGHLEKVQSYVELAKAEGGRLLCGEESLALPSEFAQGNFMRPTVVVDLEPTCRVMQEEIFGPVVTITPFDSEEEAISIANGTRYGLSATLWTRDLARGHRVAQAMEAGIIWVNTWMTRDLRTPFGGMKASGIGREGGFHSLEFFSETQNICVQYDH